MDLASFLTGLIGVFIGWFALTFIGGPVRSFYELRRESRQRLLSLTDLSFKIQRAKNMGAYNNDAKIIFRDELSSAQERFHDIGARLIAFNDTEWAAAKIVRLKFDPGLAGEVFLMMATTQDEKVLPEYSKKIKLALKIN